MVVVNDDTWMQTYTGKQFVPLNPQEDQIDVEDIAHALSLQCRYGGHCKEFYSVAQHSVLAALAMPAIVGDEDKDLAEFKFAALMHDASEAYLVDVPRPIKRELTEYKFIEAAVQTVIWDKFKVPAKMRNHGSVRLVDERMLFTEKIFLLGPSPAKWHMEDIIMPLPIQIQPWSPELAKANFLSTFHSIMAERQL